MASNIGFKPEQVREIALNFPEVKRLMNERAQIKQDAKNSPVYTKLTPYPKPKGDVHNPKVHKERDDTKIMRENHYEHKLKENSLVIENSIHDNLEKAGLEEMSDWAKEMDTQELTTFMEDGYDKVLEQREEKTVNLEQDLKMSDEKSKEVFGELETKQNTILLEEKVIQHNRDIEQNLQMDDDIQDKIFDQHELNIDDFKDNMKDLDVNKKPSPSDDFE